MIPFTLLAYVFVVLIDQVQVYKDGHRKDFWVSVVMCFISFTIALLLVFDVNIPSPAKPLKQIILLILGQ